MIKIVLFNNKFLKPAKAKISIFSDAFARGYGVFETLKACGKKAIFPEEHISRLLNSAKMIGLACRYNKKQLLNQLSKIVRRSSNRHQRLKIIAIPEGIIFTSEKLKQANVTHGIECVFISRTRSIPEVKSISCLPSFLSHKEAVEKGFFEAILTDKKGKVYEGAYSNLFWFEKNTLCTREKDILPGIIRDKILRISPFKIKFKTITAKKLLQADEIFLTNSIFDIASVIKIGNQKIGDGKPEKNTMKIIKSYKNFSRNF